MVESTSTGSLLITFSGHGNESLLGLGGGGGKPKNSALGGEKKKPAGRRVRQIFGVVILDDGAEERVYRGKAGVALGKIA